MEIIEKKILKQNNIMITCEKLKMLKEDSFN